MTPPSSLVSRKRDGCRCNLSAATSHISTQKGRRAGRGAAPSRLLCHHKAKHVKKAAATSLLEKLALFNSSRRSAHKIRANQLDRGSKIARCIFRSQPPSSPSWPLSLPCHSTKKYLVPTTRYFHPPWSSQSIAHANPPSLLVLLHLSSPTILFRNAHAFTTAAHVSRGFQLANTVATVWSELGPSR